MGRNLEKRRQKKHFWIIPKIFDVLIDQPYLGECVSSSCFSGLFFRSKICRFFLFSSLSPVLPKWSGPRAGPGRAFSIWAQPSPKKSVPCLSLWIGLLQNGSMPIPPVCPEGGDHEERSQRCFLGPDSPWWKDPCRHGEYVCAWVRSIVCKHGYICEDEIWNAWKVFIRSRTLHAVKGILQFLDGFLGVSLDPVMKISRPRS